MIENDDDREDKLSTVKDGALRLADGLRKAAILIDDPLEASAASVERAVGELVDAVRDSDEISTLIALLEQVTEYDELN